MLRTTLLLVGVAASSAYVTAPLAGVSRLGRASIVSVRMGQAPPPLSGKVPLAKKNVLAANKAQWGIDSVPAAAAAAAAAPAPKKAAAPAPAAAAGATVGFSGVPANFARPGQSDFGPSDGQTFLGMGGPRAEGHRKTFGGKHAATSLALAVFLFQPLLQAGNYGLPPTAGAPYTKATFETTLTKAPGFEKSPTLEAFLPFAKNGFVPGPALFSAESPLVFEKDLLGGCAAYGNKGTTCHTFLDEIGDALSKKQEAVPRAEQKRGGYFIPWVWKK